jgi:hypothetical protein
MSNIETQSGPGLILIFFKICDSSKISQKSLECWVDQEYVPALLATGATKTAWLYKAANANYDKQQLVVCKVSDLASIQAGQLQDAAKANKLSLFEGSVNDSVEFDTRIYSFVQLYETAKQDEGRFYAVIQAKKGQRLISHPVDLAPSILLAMMQPAQGGESELDAWYRDEHNQQMSEQPGWWRTTRYNLLYQGSSISQKSEELPFLAIHEFGEDNQLGKDVKALEPVSDWTKKLMSEAISIDAAIYHKQR